jgi:hypothetical protein
MGKRLRSGKLKNQSGKSPLRQKMDQRAILDHQFTVAAYTVTWVIQLGYVAWLGLKWRAQKRQSAIQKRDTQ